MLVGTTCVALYFTAARSAGAASLRQIANALTARGIQPPGGGEAWHAQQVRRILGATENWARTALPVGR